MATFRILLCCLCVLAEARLIHPRVAFMLAPEFNVRVCVETMLDHHTQRIGVMSAESPVAAVGRAYPSMVDHSSPLHEELVIQLEHSISMQLVLRLEMRTFCQRTKHPLRIVLRTHACASQGSQGDLAMPGGVLLLRIFLHSFFRVNFFHISRCWVSRRVASNHRISF